MTIIFLLIPLSIAAAAVFLTGFIWAVRAGQYEDTCTPAMRMLTEDRDAMESRKQCETESPTKSRDDQKK